MSLNKNRLAITAATIGAISYPVWTGSFRDWHIHCKFRLEDITGCQNYNSNVLDALLGGESVLMDVLLGAAVPAALVYFGPRLLAAWLRWVREEDVAKKIPEPPQRPSYWLILKYFLSAAALFYLAYLLRA
ncbi:MAG: hypothetical protein WBF43_12710 [Methylocella sp.]